MSHHDPDAKKSGVISGEVTPPDEHTRRVEAYKKQKEAQSSLKVHDDPQANVATSVATPVVAPSPSPVVTPSEPMRSTELSERSRKQRKRERDRRAERMALLAVIMVFLSIGGVGYWISSQIVDDVPKTMTPEELAAAKAIALQKQIEKKKATTSPLDETPDLPALRMMMSEGLTIAAEGLPNVEANAQTAEAGVLAAIETCRFAYSVWEFSPNKRFRFLTTCEAKDGQILVGAYEIKGSKVALSPLVDGPAIIVSELEVEKPSTMITKVGYGPMVFDVTQRIQTLRGGMQGEAFRATYEPRNTLAPLGTKKKETLFDAIKQGPEGSP